MIYMMDWFFNETFTDIIKVLLSIDSIIYWLVAQFFRFVIDIASADFVITDLLYVLPYACLGGSFALMDYNTKTTFSSIIIHSLHNTLTALLLLVTFFGGL